MKNIKKKDKVVIPKHSSHCGFSREQWYELNEGKTVKVNFIPAPAVDFVEEIKAQKGK